MVFHDIMWVRTWHGPGHNQDLEVQIKFNQELEVQNKMRLFSGVTALEIDR